MPTVAPVVLRNGAREQQKWHKSKSMTAAMRKGAESDSGKIEWEMKGKGHREREIESAKGGRER